MGPTCSHRPPRVALGFTVGKWTSSGAAGSVQIYSECELRPNSRCQCRCDRKGSQAHLLGAGWSSYNILQPVGSSSSCLSPTARVAFLVWRRMQTGLCTVTQGSLEEGGERGSQWCLPHILALGCWMSHLPDIAPWAINYLVYFDLLFPLRS